MSTTSKPLGVLAWGLALAAVRLAAAGQTSSGVAPTPTFTKDIAPIFQEKCEACHRPDSMAPMSLVTYEETRPWLRSIRLRVSRREMPPWHIDKTVGIQHFKNDISLSDQQIEKIVSWIDAGAPRGDPNDMPPAREWGNGEQWNIGEPDLVVMSPKRVVPAHGPDWWGDLEVDPQLTEDRWIQAIETKPVGVARRVVHHAGTTLIQPDGARESLSEFAVGKYGDIYPEGAGRLLRAGSKISFGVHFHSVGEELPVVIEVGYKLYPRGYVPKHKVTEVNVGVINGHLFDDLD